MVRMNDNRFRHPMLKGDLMMVPGMGAHSVPPEKYVANNDNHQGGRYIGLMRSAVDDENWDRPPTCVPPADLYFEAAIAEFRNKSGYVYLGSPYAKYHGGLVEAARIVSEAAGHLMKAGLRIYCPIAHGHAITDQVALPRDWDFWKEQDQPLIDAAAGLIVLMMAGWNTSVGLEYEIEEFQRAGKPIHYLRPSDLGQPERKAA